MSDSQPSDAERQQKTRSFGSFLLFIFILIVLLALFGRDSLSPSKKLTQDQYEWALYNGQIEEQESKGTNEGTNLLTGTYKNNEGKPLRFEVQYADLAGKEENFREILAQSKTFETLGPLQLEAAIEGGWYTPTEVRLLTKTEVLEPEPVPEGEEAGTQAAPRKKTHSALYVGVEARALSSWTGPGAPPFQLPQASGQMWFNVDLMPHTDRPAPDLASMVAGLERQGASVLRKTFDVSGGTTFRNAEQTFFMILIYAAPWILIFLVFMFFMRQMRSQGGAGGVMSFGRSRAQLYTKEAQTNVTFDDVAGNEEAKSEVREVVEFLKNPGRFTRIGGRMPRGVLLVGSPGCGKTLLAKAIAGEAEVPFFSISGSDFVEMFVGVGASRVRDLFKQARDNSPCIIFLDEIDAVGRRRGSGMGGGHDEREQTLNAILVEMDGFSTDKGIIVLAATNRPDVLDPALLRPGRFDREVTIDLPDLEGRRQILEVHIKRVKHQKEIDLKVLARSTPGYSGADLAAITNEAAIIAVLDKREEVSMSDLEEARDKVRYGRQKKSRNVEDSDRKITAYHEAGHAVVAAKIPEVDPPHKVTIVPRGQALGATMMLPDKESYHMQRKRLLGQLAVLFGGRVAEQEFCGDISAGASDDIKRATDLARAMVTELGMSEKVGPINYAERQGSDFLGTELMRGKQHSEETAREIDREIRALLDAAYARAEELIRAHREPIEEITRALMLYENVSGEEIKRLLAGELYTDLRPPVAPPAPSAPAGTNVPRQAPAERREDGDLPGDLERGLSPA